jgi:hypothetical protein
VTPFVRRAVLLFFVAGTGCKGCASCDSEEEEAEERDRERDHFWRAQIAIVGQGRVRTFVRAFDCTSDGRATSGECGPLLVKFRELAPATMEATPAPGWAFDHWESQIRERDGAVGARAGKMPDGRVYLNGFGYEDTGQLETVTAVFVPQG